MGKINLLDMEVANLIAAGEVVDRPASVLKELIENSIDAGATAVAVEIRRGGSTLMRVTDNGCGIAPEDLPVSVRRHATSKIRSAEDLESIGTLGFRGEALAAIASVSNLRIVTREKGRESGMMLTSSCGQVTDISEIGCAEGTTVVVEDLFANVPARRKFLKKDATETMASAAIVEKVAMSRPDIKFSFTVDGTNRFSTAGNGDLKGTLYALLGRDFATALIPVDYDSGDISVTGYVGQPTNARGNRNFQNVFINSRYIKSKTVTAALERAYVSYIAPDKFPVCALFLNIAPSSVDVNVHPAKLEVKFSDERRIFEAVYYAARGALEQNSNRPEYIPGASTQPTSEKVTPRFTSKSFAPIGGNKGEQFSMASFFSDRGAAVEGRETGTGSPSSTEIPSARVSTVEPVHLATYNITDTEPTASDAYTPSFRASNSGLSYDRPKAKAEETEPMPETKPEENTDLVSEPNGEATQTVALEPQFRIVGEAFKCYIMVEQGNELIIIDKHAAHERLIFERLRAEREKNGRVSTQGLLIPLEVTLSAEEFSAAAESTEALRNVGFEFTLGDDGRHVSLTGLPGGLDTKGAEELFVKMASDAFSGTGTPDGSDSARLERMLYQIACKAAIKGGREYGEEHIEALVKELLSTPNVTVCPHGRPVAMRMTKASLDRNFGRT